jgi:acyl-CoA reductase-like NAD-dependent aldehyde dehydrogenase
MLDKLYIEGAWREPAERAFIDVWDPFRQSVMHRVFAGGPKEVDATVVAARGALAKWRDLSGTARTTYLRAIAERLVSRTNWLGCRPLTTASQSAKRGWTLRTPRLRLLR